MVATEQRTKGDTGLERIISNQVISCSARRATMLL